MIVAIEGCMAAGKSTTARLIAQSLNWPLVLEETDSHPFLQDFYSDPNRYALETELVFILIHYHQLNPLRQRTDLVSDFSPGKDLIFARMNLSGEDLTKFEDLYTWLLRRIQMPTLAIFLRVPVDELMRRIKERGRPYEMHIPKDYVKRLEEFYEQDMHELGQDVRIIDVSPGESGEEVASKALAVIRSFLER